jgi:hypothetical protein
MDTNHSNEHLAMNADVGYDHSDLSVRGVIIFLAGVGIAGIVAHLVIWALYVGAQKLVPYEQQANPMATTQTIEPAPPLQNAGPQSVERFPEPRLQTDDALDMDTFRRVEEDNLYPKKPYQKDGAIHININDAMKLIAERGLPTRQPGQENATQSEAAPKAPATTKKTAAVGAAK